METLNEKQTPQQRKLLTAAMKLAREAAQEDGVALPALLTAVDAMAPPGFSRDYLSPETYGDFGGWVSQVVEKLEQEAKDIDAPPLQPCALPAPEWLMVMANRYEMTRDEIVDYLAAHDEDALWIQAQTLEPVELPGCLLRLEKILEVMSIDAPVT